MSDYYKGLIGRKTETPAQPQSQKEDIKSILTSFLEELKAIVRPRYKTVPKVFKGITAQNKLEVLSEQYEGMLSEITFLSTSGVAGANSYSVRIIADGESIYNDSWVNFNYYYHAYMTDVACFDDGTFYVLTFNDIFFDKSIKIDIFNVGSAGVQFDYIFIKLFKRLK